jgi:hypothetical protein
LRRQQWLTLSGVDPSLQSLVGCIQLLIRHVGFNLYALDDSECGGLIPARLETRSKHLGFSPERSYRGQYRDRDNYPSHDMTSRKAFLDGRGRKHPSNLKGQK